jgi:hypothetical protein
MRSFLLILFIISFSVICVKSQDLSRIKNESWVRIMQNDTSVNYFKAKKDYSKFRKAYKKHEAKEEKKRKKEMAEKGEHFTYESHLENPEEMVMMRYEQWARSMKPFVTSDGKVMSIEERMKIVNREHN